jgi:amino acid efflux transporter
LESKSIGLFEGIALYVTAILGSGVLFISGATASVAGPASLIAWIVVIILSFPLAYSFACLSRQFPDAGGTATFVRLSFGYHLGNLVGWFYFVCATVGQTIVSLTGAFYVVNAFNLSHIYTVLVALIILLIGGITNYYGLRVSGKVALFISVCLVILLISTVLISLPRISWDQFVPFNPFGWDAIGTAITMIFWSFFGWEAICSLSNQFKNPDKDIINSTLISAIIIGIIFLLLSFATIGTGTYGSIESNLSPIGVMMDQTLGIGAKVLTALLAFIICTGTVNAFVASIAHLGFSLSRDGAFPKWLGTVDTTSNSPRRVVLVAIIIAGVGVLMTEFLSITFYDILFIPTSLGLAVYILSMASGLKLFNKGTLPWITSLTAFILCILILPFFELFIAVPIGIAILYIVYMKLFRVKKYIVNNDKPLL